MAHSIKKYSRKAVFFRHDKHVRLKVFFLALCLYSFAHPAESSAVTNVPHLTFTPHHSQIQTAWDTKLSHFESFDKERQVDGILEGVLNARGDYIIGTPPLGHENISVPKEATTPSVWPDIGFLFMAAVFLGIMTVVSCHKF